jgi:YD repeat-containing protein
VPSRSNTVLVNSYGYNDAGHLETVTDPRGIVAKTFYDLLGRTVKTVEAYTSGTPTASTDRTVEYSYNGLGDVLTVKAVLPSSAFQTTAYIYATSATVGGTFYSNDVLSETRHPDKSTGSASSSEKETIGQNTLGELVTATDRNGTVHNYAYNVLGRLTSDKATTLGTGIDGAVRRLETTYDTLGQPLSLTSYDATSGGNVVNQVVRSYNGLSQVTAEYQSHSGAVNTSTMPKVQYAYSEMSGGANHSRLTQTVYPQGATVNYSYGSGLDAAISRITSAGMLSASNATLSSESYSYLGLGQVVVKSTPVANLSYIQATGDTSANTDAGDKYTGLDRFGRVIDQVWRNSSGSVIDRYQYGYDRSGNRLFKNNLLDTALSELYSYDNLNQLTSFSRGVLSDANSDGLLNTVASPSRTQAWNLDALGNWSTITTNSTSQSRTHNAQNQVTGVGSASLTYDANGSMTTDESGADKPDDPLIFESP